MSRVDEIRELDFTEFHDVAHRWLSATCRRQPGGPRRHARLRWEYVTWPALRRATLCRAGWHRAATFVERATGQRERRCWDCVRVVDGGVTEEDG